MSAIYRSTPYRLFDRDSFNHVDHIKIMLFFYV
jgi:hypothetical protein